MDDDTQEFTEELCKVFQGARNVMKKKLGLDENPHMTMICEAPGGEMLVVGTLDPKRIHETMAATMEVVSAAIEADEAEEQGELH